MRKLTAKTFENVFKSNRKPSKSIKKKNFITK